MMPLVDAAVEGKLSLKTLPHPRCYSKLHQSISFSLHAVAGGVDVFPALQWLAPYTSKVSSSSVVAMVSNMRVTFNIRNHTT